MTRKLMLWCVAVFSTLLVGAAPAPSALVSATEGVVGRPLTPVSYAGVARRTTRRAVYATAAATPPPPTTVVVQAPPPAPPPPKPPPPPPVYW